MAAGVAVTLVTGVLVLLSGPALAVTEEKQGTIPASGAVSFNVDAGTGKIKALASCTTRGRSISFLVIKRGDAVVASGKEANCRSDDTKAVARDAPAGVYTVELGAPAGTEYRLSITYTSPPATSTSTSSTSTSTSTSSTSTSTSTSSTSTSTSTSSTSTIVLAGEDQTAELQQLVSSRCHQAEGAVLDLGDKTYRTDGTLVLDGCIKFTLRNVTLDGSRPRSDRRHIDIKGGSEIRFENVTVRGAGSEFGLSAREHEYGVHLRAVKGFVADGMVITDVGSDFFNLSGRDNIPASENVLVQNSYLDGAGRHGFSGSGAWGLQVLDNRIRDVKRASFDFEGEDGGGRDVTIRDNDILQEEHAIVIVDCLPVNSGPYRLAGNRIYERPLSVSGEDCSSANIEIGDNEVEIPRQQFPSPPAP